MDKKMIKEVTSIPEYIEDFIKINKEKIIELYKENQKKYIIMKCNKDENKIDLMYLNDDELYSLINNNDLMIKINQKYNCIIYEKERIFLINL